MIKKRYFLTCVTAYFFMVFTALADDSIEIISVHGDRNKLVNDRLAAKNITSVEVNENLAQSTALAEWITYLPGVSLNGQGGLFQSYSIRGFSRARIRTEVDGIPIITDRRAGNSVSFIPPNIINRIDVQKGPSSTLYGSEAMGGVVNVVTSDFEQRHFLASIQPHDRTISLAALYGDDSDQYAIAYRRADNGRSALDQELNSGFEQYAGVFKMQRRWRDIAINASWLPSVGKNIGKSSNLFPHKRIVHYPDEFHHLIQVTLTSPKQWLAKIYHHYQNWDSNTLRINKRRNFTQYQSHTLGGLGVMSTTWLGAKGRLGVDWLSRQGVNIQESEQDLATHINFDKRLIDGKQNNYALFSDLHWLLNDWSVTAGIRYDYINQTQFINKQQRSTDHINGSLSIHWQPDVASSMQVELATGFRFPSLSELYFQGETPRGNTLGNPNLRAEESLGLQAHWAYRWSSDVDTRMSSYYYQLSHYIERYNVSENTRSYRNLAQATIFGVEASVNWHVSNHLLMQLNMQWQQGNDKQGNTLSDLQPVTVNHNITWQWQDYSVENTLTWHHQQNKVSSQETSRGGHLLWNIAISQKVTESLLVSLYGKNLLDKLAYTTADEDAPFIQGQHFGFKASWSF